MMRLLGPLIIVVVAIGIFVGYTNVIYSGTDSVLEKDGILHLQTILAGKKQDFDNSTKYLATQTALNKTYASIAPAQWDQLGKLLPDVPDNIRLIIEVEQLVIQHGMIMRNVKYNNPTTAQATSSASASTPADVADQAKLYGTVDMEFSIEGQYERFVPLLQDIEKSLRLVDITSITFSAPDPKTNTVKFNFKIKTYWLKK